MHVLGFVLSAFLYSIHEIWSLLYILVQLWFQTLSLALQMTDGTQKNAIIYKLKLNSKNMFSEEQFT